MKSSLHARVFLPLLALAMFTGCAAHFDPPSSSLTAPEAALTVPPKDVIQQIRAAVTGVAVHGTIESEAHGVVTTGYLPYPGAWHIVRRWEEQTQFRITVIPDWDEPLAKCRVQVVEQTQTRATAGQTWSAAPELNRRERSQALLDQIVKAAGK